MVDPWHTKEWVCHGWSMYAILRQDHHRIWFKWFHAQGLFMILTLQCNKLRCSTHLWRMFCLYQVHILLHLDFTPIFPLKGSSDIPWSFYSKPFFKDQHDNLPLRVTLERTWQEWMQLGSKCGGRALGAHLEYMVCPEGRDSFVTRVKRYHEL